MRDQRVVPSLKRVIDSNATKIKQKEGRTPQESYYSPGQRNGDLKFQRKKAPRD